jgi:hypothetical protein
MEFRAGLDREEAADAEMLLDVILRQIKCARSLETLGGLCYCHGDWFLISGSYPGVI